MQRRLMRAQMLGFGKIFTLAMITSLGLSACQKSPCDLATTNNQIEGADAMLTCLNSLDVTPTAQMPTSGSAKYNGYILGKFDPSPTATDNIIGNAVLTANFDGVGSVSGTMSNFSSTAQGKLSGTLLLTSGAIVGNVFVANVNGVLSGYGSETITIATSGSGGFLGIDAQGIAVDTTGSADFSGGHSGSMRLLTTVHE